MTGMAWLTHDAARCFDSGFGFGLIGRFAPEILSRLALETRELAEPLDNGQTKAVAGLRYVDLTWEGEYADSCELAAGAQSTARL